MSSVCICVYLCLCMCACAYVCVYIFMYLYVYICICLQVHASVFSSFFFPFEPVLINIIFENNKNHKGAGFLLGIS